MENDDAKPHSVCSSDVRGLDGLRADRQPAVRDRGMTLVVTFHHARNLQRYRETAAEELSKTNLRSRFRDSHYPFLEGTPPASDDPQLRLLYGNLPEKEGLDRMWLGKLREVMDRYQPDLIWFDTWLNRISKTSRQQFCGDYFNKAAEWGKSVVEYAISEINKSIRLHPSTRRLGHIRSIRMLLNPEYTLSDN